MLTACFSCPFAWLLPVFVLIPTIQPLCILSRFPPSCYLPVSPHPFPHDGELDRQPFSLWIPSLHCLVLSVYVTEHITIACSVTVFHLSTIRYSITAPGRLSSSSILHPALCPRAMAQQPKLQQPTIPDRQYSVPNQAKMSSQQWISHTSQVSRYPSRAVVTTLQAGLLGEHSFLT